MYLHLQSHSRSFYIKDRYDYVLADMQSCVHLILAETVSNVCIHAPHKCPMSSFRAFTLGLKAAKVYALHRLNKSEGQFPQDLHLKDSNDMPPFSNTSVLLSKQHRTIIKPRDGQTSKGQVTGELKAVPHC